MADSFPPPFSSPASNTQLDAAIAARLERLSTARGTLPASPTTPTPSRRNKRHAARGARHAALTLSLATAGGLSYLMSLAQTPSLTAAAETPGIVTSAPTTTPTLNGPAAAAPTTATATTAAPTTVNGDAYSNRFGAVQVQATFAGDGTLASVTTIQTPNSDRESVSINQRATPSLNSEALSAQSANVNTVSGATYTSNSYRQSLQSVIDIARANGLTSIS